MPTATKHRRGEGAGGGVAGERGSGGAGERGRFF